MIYSLLDCSRCVSNQFIDSLVCCFDISVISKLLGYEKMACGLSTNLVVVD